MPRLIWSPTAKNDLKEVNSLTIRRRIREMARIVKDYPNLHVPRQTRSWGLVKTFAVQPFVVAYRHSNDQRNCEVIAVIHEDLFASLEVQDQGQ